MGVQVVGRAFARALQQEYAGIYSSVILSLTSDVMDLIKMLLHLFKIMFSL